MSAARSSTHVLLLRGVNVGGKNKLPMATLVALLEEAGCEDVRTYIQSGNAVFRAAKKVADVVAREVGRAIEARLGLTVPVVLRTAAEVRVALERNPFLAEDPEEDALHVAFLAELPAKRAADALDPERSPGDRFALRGRELYLHLPNGVARTKLTNAYLDRTLGTTSTVRNWRTVTQLAAMSAG